MSERWKPGEGDYYYFVSTCGDAVIDCVAETDARHYNRFVHGNCFKTRPEAAAASQKVRELMRSLHSEPVTNCNQLPKLTVEVFDRPDCPEWAQYAAVDGSGYAYYYSERPFIVSDAFGWGMAGSENNRSELIPGKFTYINWSESRIKRPVKALPDWCKVGEWVYHDSDGYYYTVKSVDAEKDVIQIGDKKAQYTYTVNEIKTFFSQARLRQYTTEEMRELVGKVFEDRDGNLYLAVSYIPRGRGLLVGGFYFNAQEILDGGFIIDGKPCGVFEHLENGEWVE